MWLTQITADRGEFTLARFVEGVAVTAAAPSSFVSTPTLALNTANAKV